MTPPLNTKHRNLLEKVYYDEKKTYGRDALHYYLKNKYKDIPSLRQINDWLQAQKLQQLYAQTRSGGTTDKFKPEKPWNSISIDLIDFTNKPSKQFRYILVVIDNFSRFMITRKITAKEADKVSVALQSVLEEIKKKDNKSYPKYLICDDGNEFKGETLKLLERLGVSKRRTLPASPWANGLVERANGKLKILLSKIKDIHGAGWSDNLVDATKSYNEQYNRSLDMSPEKGVKLSGEDVKKMRDKVIENNEKNIGEFTRREPLKVGSKVRIKLAKGKLDKSSTPNWSSKLYIIGKVVDSKTPTIAPYYKIEGRAVDLKYSRNDVLPVDKVEEIPKRKKVALTRQAKKNVLVDGARTRSQTSKYSK